MVECNYCGNKIQVECAIKINNEYFCDEKCKKFDQYIQVTSLMQEYCWIRSGIHCGICPIQKECSKIIKIEKSISRFEDILKYDIPVIDVAKIRNIEYLTIFLEKILLVLK